MSNELNKIHELVGKLNRYRDEYYNKNSPSVSDAVYDHLYDELQKLEKETGIILSNSPTQSVGYKAVSELPKVKHDIPLLSLDKTKLTSELITFLNGQTALLMLKLDGLTIKLVYEGGRLAEGSTRGDGEEGEIITHNVPAFLNVPLKIPYQRRLIITGEGFIRKQDFEQMKDKLVGSDGKSYRNSRNLASGSIRCLDAEVCLQRKVSFIPFHVLEGLDEKEMLPSGSLGDSRYEKLMSLKNMGFGFCPSIPISPDITESELEADIKKLKMYADHLDIPIDGMVLRYDSLSYSAGCGRTGHHYKDGLAFKFEDDTCDTIFRSIEWQTSRNGEIAPVALFDPVEIDGCEVSRASLHNLSFIEGLELHPGCRILVSKRNMIIPHVEENLDRGSYENMIPETCPCCGYPTRIYAREVEKGRIVKSLHCDNPACQQQLLQRFVHFSEKKAMNIQGLSEATLQKLLEKGYIKTFQDLYHLDRYRDEILELEGFGVKSYERLQNGIEKSRHTTFPRFVTAMDIPQIGRTASRALEQYFDGDLLALELAATNHFDFTCLQDFGETMSRNIHEWFHNSDHILQWRSLQKEFNFDNGMDAEASGEENTMKNNTFTGCTIVATGKLEHFTRDSINSKIISLGAIAGSSVTKKTDYLICGEKAGSKLAKARQLGVTVLSEQQFLDMISA